MSRSRGIAAALIAVGTLMLVFASSAAGQDPGPPGNNGTVTIDGVLFDDVPDNQPHPGCEFQVDFYGFDGPDMEAIVQFFVQPPSGGPDVPLLDPADVVPLDEDDDTGGGSEEGLDASRTYDLSDLLEGFEPHPQQGFHVKLEVQVPDGSQGAETKFKVFWVECAPPPPDTTTTTTEATTTTTEATTTTVLGTTTIQGRVTTTLAKVASRGQIARTGPEDGLVAVAGAAFVLGGFLVLLGGQRRFSLGRR